MLPQKVEDALNAQIVKESYSSQLYLAMASWAETSGQPGSAAWLYAQANEERLHMLKFVKYINDRGGKAVLPAISQPPTSFINIKNLFAEVLKHEQYISNSINDIVGVCLDNKDFATHNWIQWFVTEQIEEEASVRIIIDQLALIGDGSLYQFDKDIAAQRKGANSTNNTIAT